MSSPPTVAIGGCWGAGKTALLSSLRDDCSTAQPTASTNGMLEASLRLPSARLVEVSGGSQIYPLWNSIMADADTCCLCFVVNYVDFVKRFVDAQTAKTVKDPWSLMGSPYWYLRYMLGSGLDVDLPASLRASIEKGTVCQTRKDLPLLVVVAQCDRVSDGGGETACSVVADVLELRELCAANGRMFACLPLGLDGSDQSSVSLQRVKAWIAGCVERSSKGR